MAALPPHSALSVYVNDCMVGIQPRGPHPANQQVETLTINLDMGKLQVQQSDVVRQVDATTKKVEALAVLGLCKLHAGNALILATAARPVATLGNHVILELVEAQVVASEAARSNRANKGLLKLLEDAVDPQGAGRGLYLSYTYDLTLTTQRQAEAQQRDPAAWAAQLPVQRAGAAYLWNRSISNTLLAAGAQRFVQPLVMGFVQQLPALQFTDQRTSKGVPGTLTLIARRAVARAGTRQWRRGADSSGAVANYAETEQILTVDGGEAGPGSVSSYVVVRGSIPLVWTQLPNIKYKPTTVIAPADVSGPAHDKHLSSMVDAYKSVVAINLVNQHGTEGKLEAAFRAESKRLVDGGGPTGSGLRYVAFDFHKECGKGRYHRLSVLWDQVAKDFETQSFCQLQPASGGAAGGAAKLQRAQGGVMRVNCIDCLDRTNVVQGVLARKALEAVLVSQGLMAKGMSLPSAYPEVERQFKILWADHGDALSTQYAGTGAMKSGFTRTGKRTMGGVVDDGVKAVSRYYLNNFEDGHKQDAVDLFTGAYVCDTITAPPLKAQPSPLVPIVLALLALGIAAHNTLTVFAYFFSSGAASSSAAASSAAAATAAGGGLLGSARHLASAVIFTPPSGASTLAKGAAAGGIRINPTAASVAEPAAAAGGWLGALAVYGVVPLVLGAGLLLLVVRNGKHLVNKPQLCPQLAVTVAKAAKGAAKDAAKKHA